MAAQLDATLAALADPMRRRVLERLRRRPRRAGELAAAEGVSAPAMSRHLRVLRTQGLVDETRDESDARARIYRLRPEHLKDLQDWLSDFEAFWSDQLDSLRADAERRSRKGQRGGKGRRGRS